MSDPIHIISLGAGVQSSTMALMAAAGEITPMPHCAIFADTQDEPAAVYKWLEWLEPRLPFPVDRVTAGKLSEHELRIIRSKKSGKLYRKNRIPAFVLKQNGGVGLLGRSCTLDFKITPLVRKTKELCGLKRSIREIRAIMWIGISLDEAHRMKPSRAGFIENRWPLIDKNITRQGCLNWMSARGFPTPPRSACRYCPFHSDEEWRSQKENAPEEFAKSVEFEREMISAGTKQEVLHGTPYLHQSCVPLDQVDFGVRPHHGQMDLFGNECEGMCGV